MTFDHKVTVFLALRNQRAAFLNNWVAAHQFSGEASSFWAERIALVNDAEAALRQALPYGAEVK